MDSAPALGIIGAGKVGMTLARLWRDAGYEVAAIYSRRVAAAHELGQHVGAAVVDSAGDVTRAADLTMLTVPDDVIEPLAGALDGDLRGKGIVHTSGARSVDVLVAASERGAMVGSLHPIFPFASVEAAMKGLAGATFAVEAQDIRLRGWLEGLVAALDGQALAIAPGRKALYHSALTLLSNYTVTLYALAERLLVDLGAEQVTADAALNTLLGATTENLRAQGIPAALTGPLVRADAGTAAAHLEALGTVDTELAELYRRMALLSLPMLQARGVPTARLEPLLKEG